MLANFIYFGEIMEQRENRSKTIVLLIIVIGALVAFGFIGYKFFMVEKVTIKGNSYYSSEEIADLAAIPMNTHVFTLDKDQVKSNIEADPRVIVESIDYDFPNAITINVKERIPAAVADSGEGVLILSNDMIVIETGSGDTEDVPKLTGLTVEDAQLGSKLEADDPYKVSMASEIVTAALHEGVLDKYESIDLSDTNKVMIDSKAGFQINFGQGDNYAEKTGWISKMLDSLAKETVKTGTIDVSSGKFATFRP